MGRQQANIIAPCPHHLTCPLSKNNEWCRFEQNWLRFSKNILPKLSNEQNMIKSRFSYLIIKKGETDLNETEKDDSMWHRIIKPTKRKGKHSIITICNNQGKVESRTIAKSHGDTYGYRASKELKWGDYWKYPLRLSNKYRKEINKGKKLW